MAPSKDSTCAGVLKAFGYLGKCSVSVFFQEFGLTGCINSQGLPLNGCVHVLKDNLLDIWNVLVRNIFTEYCIFILFFLSFFHYMLHSVLYDYLVWSKE